MINIGLIFKKTITELKKAGIETAELDARVLLEDVLNKDSSYIFSHSEMPLTNSQYAKFRSQIRRRKKGEPVAYLTGHKEFYGYDFFVNKNVLIPRPETELIVEETINYIKNKILKNKKLERISIIDIGTGSGCIIVSLVLQLYKLSTLNFQLKNYASDISRKALYVAQKNAKKYQVKNQIRFFHSNLFSNPRMPKKYDIIIANLPYVPTSYKSQTKSLNYEPKSAIFADDNGTQIIKQFLNQAKSRINDDGLILIEVDPRNAKKLKNYAQNIFITSKTELLKDLARLDRILIILN